MIHYTPTDYKKFLYVHGVQRLDRLVEEAQRLEDAAPDVLGYEMGNPLCDMHKWLYRCAFVDDDEVVGGVLDVPPAHPFDESPNVYSDGRPVTTKIEWPGGWHTHLAPGPAAPR